MSEHVQQQRQADLEERESYNATRYVMEMMDRGIPADQIVNRLVDGGWERRKALELVSQVSKAALLGLSAGSTESGRTTIAKRNRALMMIFWSVLLGFVGGGLSMAGALLDAHLLFFVLPILIMAVGGKLFIFGIIALVRSRPVSHENRLK
ncbi:MAG: hypothetical protein ACLFVU_05085 [Phycisphaerae bacterium]